MKKITICAMMIICFSVFAAFAGDWKINNDETQMSFKIKGPFGTVNGTVKNLTGSINFDEKKLSDSKIDVRGDATTIKTGNNMRDRHLKKEEWFDASKFPSIHFISQSFSQTPEGFIINGILTLKDVSKPISFPFTVERKGKTSVFKGEFTINRIDYGVGEKSFTVGNDVHVLLEVPATEK
jgi:polyisoprenoid-binding protein YceI